MTSSVDCNCKFSERTFSTPAISKAMSKLFSSQDCSDDKNCLYFSSIFFKICRFRNSTLLSLLPRQAMLESSLTVVWFSWTNQNSFAMYNNQWDCFICIDNRLCQMAFFVFVKVGRVQGKGRLSHYVERFWTKKSSFCSSLFRYYIKQIDSMLSCICSVIDHRRRQNVASTSSVIASCVTFLFLPHFDVICDLLLNRRTATWNLFVNCTNQLLL